MDDGPGPMRIATWNVNSLGARLGKVEWWIERAAPDVLLIQETKLADEDAPHEAFEKMGYTFHHHGQGRWNGVAIATKSEASDLVVNFGDPVAAEVDPEDPFTEARMIAATIDGVRLVSVYVPNGRQVDSPFYAKKLEWLDRLVKWVEDEGADALIVGGDYNVAPADIDVWDAEKCHGGTHVSGAERERIANLEAAGLVDVYRAQHPEGNRYSWWDYRQGAFHKNMGMRIDLLMSSAAVVERAVWTEIDREARKGKPIPSDHTPVVVDLDGKGKAFDAKWARADAKLKKK